MWSIYNVLTGISGILDDSFAYAAVYLFFFSGQFKFESKCRDGVQWDCSSSCQHRLPRNYIQQSMDFTRLGGECNNERLFLPYCELQKKLHTVTTRNAVHVLGLDLILLRRFFYFFRSPHKEHIFLHETGF